MITNENILFKFRENLKLYSYSPNTQRKYLQIARDFLSWSNNRDNELSENDIEEYLIHLKETRCFGHSVVQTNNSAIQLLFATITGNKKFYLRRKCRCKNEGCLNADREAFIKYLNDMKYEFNSINVYQWTINHLERFMTEHGWTKYSRQIGQKFLEDITENMPYASTMIKKMKCTIRRFDCFKEDGEYACQPSYISTAVPIQFADEFDKYLDSLRKRGLKESGIESQRYNLQKILVKFDSAGMQHFNEITPKIIYDVFNQISDKGAFSCPMRGLLRYLFEIKVIKIDYSEFVPTVRKLRPVPTIYTASETQALLEYKEVNPCSAIRNKAVILLALKLGMRSGDIANLKFSNIDFNNKNISFIQEKTNVPNRLELLPEIEETLLEYISKFRQNSNIPNIFLTIRAPIRSITTQTVNRLISKRFEKIDIDTNGRKRGGHALRSTLASELVAEKVPYAAVRKILGHEDPFTLKHYVRFDIKELRSCAIETPPIGGKLSEYITAMIGGV